MDFSQIGINAAQEDDLTVDKKIVRELPREGIAMIRYVGYIETGKHIPSNPSYNAALKCIHIIELHHPDHMVELEDGTRFPQKMYIHLNKGTTAKSGYRKLFNVMNKACDNKFKHFVQMLGAGFLGEIYHNAGEKDKKYANLHLNGAWSFRKPVMVDVLTNKATPVPIPEPSSDLLGFLWENDAVSDEDVVAMWNSLYIEGERDDKSSKNWIQETIMENIEWEGSRTQALTQEFVQLEETEDKSLSDLAGMAESSPDDTEESDIPF